jgi:predicted lipoprotein with Yx(FWY)xxD motif
MKIIKMRNALVFAALMLSAVGAQAAMLTAKNGMTLYVFDKDKGRVSSCYGFCADFWPPYIGKKGEKMNRHWTLLKRKNGKMQWAYNGKPVYFYKADKKKGDMTGDGKEGIWHIVKQ